MVCNCCEDDASSIRKWLNFIWSNLGLLFCCPHYDCKSFCSPTKLEWLGSTALNGTIRLCHQAAQAASASVQASIQIAKASWWSHPSPEAPRHLIWSRSRHGLLHKLQIKIRPKQYYTLKFWEVTVPWLEQKLWPLLRWNRQTTARSWLCHPFACMTMDMEVGQYYLLDLAMHTISSLG